MITKQEVIVAQQAWRDALINTGRLRNNMGLCRKEAEMMLRKLYAFEKGPVLFKPTLASTVPFRSTFESALSYMLGGDPDFPEDIGFALKPWINVVFDNQFLILEERRAIAMGHYVFVDEEGKKIKAEYTFGYWKNDQGELKIDVQHSSLPYRKPG